MSVRSNKVLDHTFKIYGATKTIINGVSYYKESHDVNLKVVCGSEVISADKASFSKFYRR